MGVDSQNPKIPSQAWARMVLHRWSGKKIRSRIYDSVGGAKVAVRQEYFLFLGKAHPCFPGLLTSAAPTLIIHAFLKFS